jgi:hypothetical protein
MTLIKIVVLWVAIGGLVWGLGLDSRPVAKKQVWYPRKAHQPKPDLLVSPDMVAYMQTYGHKRLFTTYDLE